MSQQPNPLTSHEYDGIREYDNPTPGWWHAIFLGTVVFSAFYMLFWHGSPVSWTVEQAWEKNQQAEYARIFGKVGELKPDAETILGVKNNAQFMAIAQGLFKGTCAQCHAGDGGGLAGSGVNLADNFYKNVTKVEDLYAVITEGAAGGSMPAQKNRFSQNERVLLAAYAAALRGTTPGAPKAPEGNEIPAWPVVTKVIGEDKK